MSGAGPAQRWPSRLVLLGHPVAHSLSPLFQTAALARAGIAVAYDALDVAPASLPALLDALVRERVAGNVTIPFKHAVAARCTRRTAIAEQTGAVNTFWVEDGALVGDNTDGPAFHDVAVALLGGVPAGACVAVLGAGGAAAAVVAAAAAWPGVEIRVWGRTRERATALAARWESVASVAATARDAVRGASLVVNATPVGLHDESIAPIDPAALPGDCAVLDLVYGPGETAWVRAARARGHRAADGLGMLIAQGALAFERWFGTAPDRAAMWDAVRPVAGARTAR